MAKFNGFKGNYEGLNNEEVLERQLKHGQNELTKVKKVTLLTKIIEIFFEPMFILLILTSLLYFILNEPNDGIIMLVFVVLMITINIIQEWRTDKALQALKELSSPKAKVIRNNQMVEITSAELTVDDLMILNEGDRVSADGIIVENINLAVDESTLTGESAVVWKNEKDQAENSKWKTNYCYAGTSITYGSAIVKVTSIGENTEYGKIGKLILKMEENTTPLNLQINKLVKISGLFALILCLLVFTFAYLNSDGVDMQAKIVDSILAGVTVAMSMIPEEFPVILTIFLAMGSYRLAKNYALMRKISATETLGAITVLCVDKTGTLTENEMTIQEVYINGDETQFHKCMELACEEEPYDPMEKAILKYNKEHNYIVDRKNSKLIYDYAFMHESKMMGHVWDDKHVKCLAVKGSPEGIIEISNLTKEEKNKINKKIEEMASNGYRVIAVASSMLGDVIPLKLNDNKLEFLGLIGFEDPSRQGVKEAVQICKQAGIRVVMITGDHAMTAASIAKKNGIDDTSIITGAELDKMSASALQKEIKHVSIFARVIPEHKLKIVKALKEKGEVVGMTGDGVNDAPALKSADIGIVMGKRGTNVAKEVADMIILDDNFTTIVNTIKDGRRIYDNIKKSIGYVIIMHIIIAFLALLPSILGLPLFLLPIHIVLLEMIIDPTCSIVFERQPAEKDIMERKPRHKDESLVSLKLLSKSIIQAIMISLFTLGSYIYIIKTGNSVELARSFGLVVLILSSLLLVYINQSNDELYITNMFKNGDNLRTYINLAIFSILTMAIYLPFGNDIFKTTILPFDMLIVAILFSIIGTVWWELVKIIKNKFKKKEIL